MFSDRLTRQNSSFSRPTIAARNPHLAHSSTTSIATNLVSEVNFTDGLPDRVANYVENSLSEGTRRVYAADLSHFNAWGGTVPTSDLVVAGYLADHAEVLAVATLVRRLSAISKAHTAKGFSSPTCSELVKATMRGIKRSRGTAQTEAKPLLRDDLFLVLERMGNDMKSTWDRVLLLIGFAGGFRRSELVGLGAEDIEHVRQGIIVHLRRSKTDQDGAGGRSAFRSGGPDGARWALSMTG